mmetsp:Transcript_103457/g.183473  ORF Transcript_103457/g.183473 Transcript_103457/m.183473 type:complete len:705 (+) Transcript_103457:187-2301(+)
MELLDEAAATEPAVETEPSGELPALAGSKRVPKWCALNASSDVGECTTEGEDLEEDEEISEEEADLEGNDTSRVEGVPPNLKQVPLQKRKRRRANRVSICIAKCRSSSFVVQRAVQRLQWEQVSRDTPEISVSWLEHTDSTAMVSPFQVMSKIEGVLQVCRKADLAACLQAMQERFPDEYDFIPRTWIISGSTPEQAADLEKTMSEKKGWTYICKPTSGSQGRGLRLVKTFAELRGPLRDAFPRGAERLRPAEYVVQRYVTKPLLVDGYKFDCRCYVIITSVVPLCAYLFQEGLARFCTTKYEKPRGRNLGNSCMHLTNFAVNKHSDAFECARAHDSGSKRSLSSVFDLIESEGGPSTETLWGEIQSVAEKTLIALRPALVEHVAQGEHGALHPAGPKGFHILGFDILFDERYHAILIELNANSSMSVLQPSSAASEGGCKTEVSELDAAIKSELIVQALLVANPLPHRTALRKRIAWLEEAAKTKALPIGMCPPVDEPIPLDDDGHLVHASAAPALPRPDRPRKCLELAELGFEEYAAFHYVRLHLQAYRIWRHFSFNPPGSCPLKRGQLSSARRYLGFGRAQFRQLCEAAGFSGPSSGSNGRSRASQVCWPDRATAELFFTRITRGLASSPLQTNDDAHPSPREAQSTSATLDFPRFIRRLAIPVGELLVSDAANGNMDPLEAFVNRVLGGTLRGPSSDIDE